MEGDLGGEVGNAVAEVGQRQVLEDQVAEPAMRRRPPVADLRLDQRVGQLGLAAGVKAKAQALLHHLRAGPRLVVEQLAVGPDA